MINEEIINYIKKAEAQDLTTDQIQENLLKAGWPESQVKDALEKDISKTPLDVPIPPKVPNQSTPPQSKSHSMWDAFEHILLFISLYVLATSLALMLHLFVDKYIPGISTSRLMIYSYLARGYMASLIVSYPLFSFFFLRSIKRVHNNPSIRNIHSRKVLIYFTLVVTFLIVLANIVSIIYNFLGGNVTLNFIFHFAVTVIISSIIFWYYLNEVKEDRKAYA